ncbi:MAG: LamB/YcsF family protein [Chitinophagaceae bacterium]|nr:LamB/YcsF family protein [Chitinophagaceae bacterium]
MLSIDLNCDIGESTLLWPYSIDHDLSLMQYVSSINIACGFHAGDTDTTQQLIAAAIPRNIAVGAHPSFPDRENFGRKEMNLDEKDLYRIIYQQIEFIAGVALSKGVRIQHVKPHGALYNMAARDHRLAFILCSAIQSYDEDLMIYGLSGSELITVADCMGLRSCSEVFADRTYQDDGSLTPRSSSNALIEDESQSLEQVLEMIIQGTVTSVQGMKKSLKAETVCIHSDGKHALKFAKTIHEALVQHGIDTFHP